MNVKFIYNKYHWCWNTDLPGQQLLYSLERRYVVSINPIDFLNDIWTNLTSLHPAMPSSHPAIQLTNLTSSHASRRPVVQTPALTVFLEFTHPCFLLGALLDEFNETHYAIERHQNGINLSRIRILLQIKYKERTCEPRFNDSLTVCLNVFTITSLNAGNTNDNFGRIDR